MMLPVQFSYFKLKSFPVYIQFDEDHSAFRWRRRRRRWCLKIVRSVGDKLLSSSCGIGRTNGADCLGL